MLKVADPLKKLVNLVDFRFQHVCVQNRFNFVFKISKMVEIKTKVDRLLLVLRM